MSNLINLHADAVRHVILSSPMVLEWADCHRLLMDSTIGTPSWILALPVISCLAVGGSSTDGVPVAACLMALNHASHLLDNVEDGDFEPDGEVNTAGRQLNISTASIFLAFHFLSNLQSKERCSRVLNVFSECGFNATQGQHMSFDPRPAVIDDAIHAYWQATILKSGSLFRMACAGGAAAGTDSPDLIDALGDYGTAIGVILQVLDDCRDMLDKKSGKYEISLPILLYSASLGGKEIIFPESRKNLNGTGVPETITAALEAWWQRAQISLNRLEPSDAREILLETMRSIVGDPVWGEV
jgi:hypothetical protein